MIVQLNLIPTSTPTMTISFPLDLNSNVHILFAQKVDRPLANIFEVCSPPRNHMDYPQNTWAVFAMVVVIMVIMVRAVVMFFTRIMSVAMAVAVAMVVPMVVVAMIVAMIVIVSSDTRIIQPKFGSRISCDSAYCTNTS